MADLPKDDDSIDLLPPEPVRKRPATTAATAAVPMAAGGANVDPLVARLRHEADVAQAGGMTSVAGGAAICVFVSAALGVLLSFVFYLWFDTTGLGVIGWTILFLLAFGGAVFMLLRPAPPAADAGRYVAGAPAELLSRGVLDWPLLGPRMLVLGIRHAQGAEPVARAYFYDRCALLLRMLGKRGEQAPVSSMLISEDETPAMLGKVIGYLDKTGWLGASSNKERVWLSTKGRTVLLEMGVVPDNDVVRGG